MVNSPASQQAHSLLLSRFEDADPWVPVLCCVLQERCVPQVLTELSSVRQPGGSAPGMLAEGCARHFHPDCHCRQLWALGLWMEVEIPRCEPYAFFGAKQKRFSLCFSGNGLSMGRSLKTGTWCGALAAASSSQGSGCPSESGVL